MRGPSEHLTWAELACRDGTPYPREWRQTRAVSLSAVFEIFREECGGYPLYVLSAFRTPEHNASIPNAASGSQHVQGRALDVVRPIEVTTYGEFVAAAFRARERSQGALNGIGVYPERNTVHLDVRENEYLALWT